MTFRLPLLLSTLVWVLQTLAPLVHLYGDHAVPEREADCHQCEEQAAGPGLESACTPTGSCKQPDHHHHHANHRHDDQCLVCKNLVSRLATEPSAQGLRLPWLITLRYGQQAGDVCVPEQLAHLARGPPSEVV